MQLLVLMQDPSQWRPAGQYSKGQAPLCHSPATAGSHTHLAVIMTLPAPPGLNNLAGVSPSSAPTRRVRPPSVCQHSLFAVVCFFDSLIGPPRLWCRDSELQFGREGGGGREGLSPTLRLPCFLFICHVLAITTGRNFTVL